MFDDISIGVCTQYTSAADKWTDTSRRLWLRLFMSSCGKI